MTGGGYAGTPATLLPALPGRGAVSQEGFSQHRSSELLPSLQLPGQTLLGPPALPRPRGWSSSFRSSASEGVSSGSPNTHLPEHLFKSAFKPLPALWPCCPGLSRVQRFQTAEPVRPVQLTEAGVLGVGQVRRNESCGQLPHQCCEPRGHGPAWWTWPRGDPQLAGCNAREPAPAPHAPLVHLALC